jgi:hypothetical protein
MPDTPPPTPPKTISPVHEFTFMDFLNMIIFLGLAIAGGYYGWKFGGQWSYGYWTKIQEWGVYVGYIIGSLFTSAKSKVASYRNPTP